MQDGIDAGARGGASARDLATVFQGLAVGGSRLEACPVSGCPCSHDSGHPGFGREALKAHIDAHLLGILEGQVPTEWMSAFGRFSAMFWYLGAS